MLYVNEYCFDKSLCTRLLKKEFKVELTKGPLIGHGNTAKELVYDFLALCLLCQSFPYYAASALSSDYQRHVKFIWNTHNSKSCILSISFSFSKIQPANAILNKPTSTRLNMSTVCQRFLVIYKTNCIRFCPRLTCWKDQSERTSDEKPLFRSIRRDWFTRVKVLTKKKPKKSDYKRSEKIKSNPLIFSRSSFLIRRSNASVDSLLPR